MLGIGLVSIAVITRYLGPDDYGRYTLALTYMQLFAVLADVGLFTIVVRDISRDPSRTEELVGNTLTLRLVLSAVVIAVAAAISLLLPYDPDVRVAILLAGLPLLFGMLGSTFVTVLQSRLRMGRAVVGDVLGRAVALGAVALVAALDLGFYAVMGAAAAGALATAITTMLLARPLARVRFRAEPAVWRGLLRTALPLGLALAVNELYFRADTLIAKERQMSALWLNLSALVFNVGLNLLLVPRYGIVVAAAVTVASEMLILAGSYVLMRRYFGFFPAPRTLVPALVAAVAMGGLLWVLRDAPLAAVVPLGAAVYAGILWATSPASRELVAGMRA